MYTLGSEVSSLKFCVEITDYDVPQLGREVGVFFCYMIVIEIDRIHRST